MVKFVENSSMKRELLAALLVGLPQTIYLSHLVAVEPTTELGESFSERG